MPARTQFETTDLDMLTANLPCRRPMLTHCVRKVTASGRRLM